jgi:hypothetical protein
MAQEKSLAAIIEHKQRKYALADLPKDCLKFLEVELRIIESRLNGLSFCQLEGNNLRVATDQILLSGAAISGCPLPHTEGFAEILSNEIIEFVNEYGYGELTLEEILTALRLNARGGLKLPTGIEVEHVPFSGNCFNVVYLSKVLSNYKTFRDILERRLQNFIDGY